MNFVVSTDPSFRALGTAKQIDPKNSPDILEYFVSPSSEVVRHQTDPGALLPAVPRPQERVYFQDEQGWKVGRVEHVEGSNITLALPNLESATVSFENAFIRSEIPIENPLGLLQTQNAETPFWHEKRSSILEAITEQRVAYGGLSGIASSNVDVLLHQLDVIRKILNDPTPRYLLSDEVGLGKTIEVGAILRQLHLDDPENFSAVALVPDHLLFQWRHEIRARFQLDEGCLQVVKFSEAQKFDDGLPFKQPQILVIDEAHQLCTPPFNSEGVPTLYDRVSEITRTTKGVLLCSATPVIHNEEALLAMLHLLDPETHSLEDIEGFKHRIEHRKSIAHVVRALDDTDIPGFMLQPVIEQIRPLTHGNAVLSERLDSVDALSDGAEDDSDRQLAIRELHSHLLENYKLDRRILRSRRSHEHVKDHLGERCGQLWVLEDPMREKATTWFESWRDKASRESEDQTTAHAMAQKFLQALLIHPITLDHEIAARSRRLRQGETELFEGELQLLDSASEPELDRDPRIQDLRRLIQEYRTTARWVVFASAPEVADAICNELRRSFSVLRLHADENAGETVEKFRKDKVSRIIVCDQNTEDGVNLQRLGRGMKHHIVHFDLPLDPSRIEQRIGRLDRLGADAAEINSFVPSLNLSDESTPHYERDWADSLFETVDIFSSSTAALEYPLDLGRQKILEEILHQGIYALEAADSAWADSDGDLSLAKQRESIEDQEFFDETVAVSQETKILCSAIEGYEYCDLPGRGARLKDSLNGWMRGALHFRSHIDDRQGLAQNQVRALEYEFSERALMSQPRFMRYFGRSFLPRKNRNRPATGLLHTDRDQAMLLETPVARIGHPLIDEIKNALVVEERGRAYACWRHIENHTDPTGLSTSIYFRFDFIIEANHREVLRHEACASLPIGVVQRRVEENFPPTFHTIWTNDSGVPLTTQNTSQELLDQLQLPYERENDRDTNIRHEHWHEVERLAEIGDWSTLCNTCFESAASHLREAAKLEQRIDEAHRHLATQHQLRQSRLQSRIAALKNASGDSKTLELEEYLYRGIHNAIGNANSRLDAVGAIFLSSENPFV